MSSDEPYQDDYEDDVDVPAVCGVCGATFPSGIAMAPGSSGWIQNAFARCPRCGGIGQVPDGFWQVASVVTNVARSVDLATLTDVVRLVGEAQGQKQVDREQLAREVEARSPFLQPLVRLLRDPAVHGGAAVLSLIFTILFGVLQARSATAPSDQSPSPRTGRQVVADQEQEGHEGSVDEQGDAGGPGAADCDRHRHRDDQGEPQGPPRPLDGPHDSSWATD